MKTKFIVINGGVISGLGKGIVTSTIGNLLESSGFKVNAIKFDPYLNLDAGTMRPTEHGEVFVTTDGGETDQDIGSYERFLGINLSKKNNITNGQVYLKLIQDERALKFKGACVEVVPHVALEFKRRILEIAKKDKPDFLLIEIGGTIGEYQNILFLEALRMMKIEKYPIMFIHVTYLPIPKKLGEMKTKPLQLSLRSLNATGIQADMIICRAEKPIDSVRKKKIMLFSNVNESRIISSPDVDNIYKIPNIFYKQNVTKEILKFFNIKAKTKNSNFNKIIKNIDKFNKKVKIGIVGKYFATGKFTLKDSYVSVIEAIKHAAWNLKATPEIIWIDSNELIKNTSKLKECDGIIVPGGFGASGIEGKLKAINYARKNNIPYLGLCYGMQLALIEIARNVCKLKDANTEEIDPNTKHKIISIMESQKENLKNNKFGGSMRLGAYAAKIKKNTKVYSLYKELKRFTKDKQLINTLKKNQKFRIGNQTTDLILERHRHRYEVNNKYVKCFETKAGVIFSGTHTRLNNEKLMEFIELKNHRFFVATQAHPEFTSRLTKPSPLFYGFIREALKK